MERPSFRNTQSFLGTTPFSVEFVFVFDEGFVVDCVDYFVFVNDL